MNGKILKEMNGNPIDLNINQPHFKNYSGQPLTTNNQNIIVQYMIEVNKQ